MRRDINSSLTLRLYRRPSGFGSFRLVTAYNPPMRFAALLGMVSLLAAQDPAPTQAPPVIKMTTRQVQVSVVVRDKKVQPVADLKREDFTVLDQGKPQEIRY